MARHWPTRVACPRPHPTSPSPSRAELQFWDFGNSGPGGYVQHTLICPCWCTLPACPRITLTSVREDQPAMQSTSSQPGATPPVAAFRREIVQNLHDRGGTELSFATPGDAY